MRGKTAAVIGATGMIGQYLIKALLNDPYFDTVRVIVRRPYPKANERMEVKLVDFNDTESLKLALEETDIVFSTIGTTQKKIKGDKTLYRQIDFDIPVRAARLSKETGCEKFITITSVGADSSSSNFYLKLKGEVEDALQSVGIRSVHVFQPSVLLGDRKERRPGESILQGSMKFISPLIPKKYKPIHGSILAAAMIHASKKEEGGFFKYTYEQIVLLSGSSIVNRE